MRTRDVLRNGVVGQSQKNLGVVREAYRSAAPMFKQNVPPTTLAEALECLAVDQVLQEALGLDYARYYMGVKRNEWQEYHRSVSPWEVERYLKTY